MESNKKKNKYEKKNNNENDEIIIHNYLYELDVRTNTVKHFRLLNFQSQ